MPSNRTSRPEAARREKERSNGFNYLSFPTQPHPHSMVMVFKEYDFSRLYGKANEDGTISPGQAQRLLSARSDQFERTSGITLRSANTVELPFPKQLVDNTSVRANNMERDLFTESIARRVNDFINGSGQTTIADIPGLLQGAGAGMAQILSGKGDDSAKSRVLDIIGGALGTDLKDVATGAQYLLRRTLPGDISRTIDNVTGQTINPRETLSFEGVNLRQHNFSWELYPNNEQDSESIRNIINMIKRNSLPEVQDLGGAVPSAFLRYPSTVDMYLVGINGEHFMKFKPSMVQSVSVDYGAAGGVSIMRGGKPAGVNLTIQLSELEIETAHDYGTPRPPAIQPAENPVQEKKDIFVNPGRLDNDGFFNV